MLSDEAFVEEMTEDLHALFKQDEGFDKSNFERQISVMGGQIQNLVTALREKMTPLELIQLPVFTIKKEKNLKRRIQIFLKKRPKFSWC